MVVSLPGRGDFRLTVRRPPHPTVVAAAGKISMTEAVMKVTLSMLHPFVRSRFPQDPDRVIPQLYRAARQNFRSAMDALHRNGVIPHTRTPIGGALPTETIDAFGAYVQDAMQELPIPVHIAQSTSGLEFPAYWIYITEITDQMEDTRKLVHRRWRYECTLSGARTMKQSVAAQIAKTNEDVLYTIFGSFAAYARAWCSEVLTSLPGPLSFSFMVVWLLRSLSNRSSKKMF